MADTDSELRRLYSCVMHDKHDGVDREDMFIREVGIVVDKLLTAHTEVVVRRHIEALILDCKNCSYRTTYLEADLRKFNNGMCGSCGADALNAPFNQLYQLINPTKQPDTERSTD